jgi:AcrR family transcriptional regulator
MRKKRSPYAGTEKRKQAIIRAALRCFSEIGFVDTTMKDIRLHSGSSNGSIYHHFKSKEHLAAAVYLEGIVSYQTGMLAELERCKSARQGISSIIGYHLGWTAENQGWARFLSNMRHAEFLAGEEKAIEKANLNFARTIWKFFSRHIEQGTLKSLAPEFFISIILGPCHEFSRHWLNRPGRVDWKDASSGFADAAWGTLKAGEK